MIAFVIALAIILTLILNHVFVKKIHKRNYRICMGIANVILSLVFLILFFVIGVVKNNIDSFIDYEISNLEKKVDEIYPGALEIQMNTSEIKELLEKSLEKNSSGGIEAIAENIVKQRIEKYTSVTLKTIRVLERDTDKLSVKDALISIKEESLKVVLPFIGMLKTVLFILYFLLLVISIVFAKSLQKEEENQGVIFGEEADKTFIGMKNK